MPAATNLGIPAVDAFLSIPADIQISGRRSARTRLAWSLPTIVAVDEEPVYQVTGTCEGTLYRVIWQDCLEAGPRLMISVGTGASREDGAEDVPPEIEALALSNLPQAIEELKAHCETLARALPRRPNSSGPTSARIA